MKQKLDEMLNEEKKEDPVCGIEYFHWNRKFVCQEKLIFDILIRKYYCPKHSKSSLQSFFDSENIRVETNKLEKKLDSTQMLDVIDYSYLERLKPRLLILILKLRENKFNYLYHEWQDACKGDRKASFFLERLKAKETEFNELKKEYLQVCNKQKVIE